jgi:hypothetical protein
MEQSQWWLRHLQLRTEHLQLQMDRLQLKIDPVPADLALIERRLYDILNDNSLRRGLRSAALQPVPTYAGRNAPSGVELSSRLQVIVALFRPRHLFPRLFTHPPLALPRNPRTIGIYIQQAV